MNFWFQCLRGDVVVRMRFVTCVLASAVALTACSKSPSAVVAGAVNSFALHLMQPIVQKDASGEAKRMVQLLSDRPECEVYKRRMLDAGRGSPYAGMTQWKIVHTQRDACAAGCCK
jgi:hypothetical protein